MSTTEIFIEQVIVGLLMLLIGCLLGGAKLVHWLLTADLGSLVVVVALAYLLGIVFDRMGDTVLARLERHNRLHFAAEIADKEDARRNSEAAALKDPFPEEEYRIRMLGGDGAAKLGDYLRSRIRLTRALAFSSPALALSSSVAVMEWLPDPALSSRSVALVRWAGAAVLAGVYGLIMLWRSSETSDVRLRKYAAELNEPGVQAELTLERVRGRPAVLRTRHMATRAIRETYCKKTGYPGKLALFVFRNDGALVGMALVLCGLSVIPAKLTHQLVVGVAIALGGIALTAVAGWCWWRITRTFFTLLRDFARSQPGANAKASSDTSPVS